MPATRVRHGVLALTCAAAFLMYVDRVAIGAATPAIMEEFGIDKIAMGWSSSAFNWAYAVFQVPGGWMADRSGPRAVVAGALAWLSLFTAATGWAASAVSLAAARFLFGIGQAAAWPGSSRALVRWLGVHQRASAQGLLRAGSRFGAAVTPALVVFIMSRLSWHWAFYLFGGTGFLLACFWYYYYRNYPQDHPGVNPEELDVLKGSGFTAKREGKPVVPWRRILASPNVWFLSAMYFCYGWILWMYLSWLPTYLVEARHFTEIRMGLAASAPLVAASLSNMFGGWLSDRLARRLGDLRRGRVWVSMIGFSVAGAALVPGVLADTAAVSLMFLTLALAGSEMTVGISWAMCIDIGGDFSGSVSAVMNTFGNISGAMSAVATGYLATHFGWNTPFLVASAMCAAAVVLTSRINPARPAVET